MAGECGGRSCPAACPGIAGVRCDRRRFRGGLPVRPCAAPSTPAPAAPTAVSSAGSSPSSARTRPRTSAPSGSLPGSPPGPMLNVLVNSASSCATSRTTAPPPGAPPRLMHGNATYRGRANILKRPNRLNVRSGSVAGPPPYCRNGGPLPLISRAIARSASFLIRPSAASRSRSSGTELEPSRRRCSPGWRAGISGPPGTVCASRNQRPPARLPFTIWHLAMGATVLTNTRSNLAPCSVRGSCGECQ
jgi:hypothetical protein